MPTETVQADGRVSVIIPTYNRAACLPRAVASVLRQTAAHLCDIYIIDDGSTDDTAAVVRSFGGRVHYLSQANAGAAAARNAGIRASTGEFVAFLDTDDEWLPEKTAKQLELLHRYPDAVLATGRSLASYQDGHTRPHHLPGLPFDTPVDMAQIMFDRNFMPTPTVMVRRRFLEQTDLFAPELRRRHDYHLFVRLCTLGPGIYLNDLVTFYADDTPAGLSRDKPVCLRYKLQARRMLREALIRRPDCRAAWHRGMAETLADLRDQTYRAGRYAEAARCAVETLWHAPWRRPKWEWGRLLAAAWYAMLYGDQRATPPVNA